MSEGLAEFMLLSHGYEIGEAHFQIGAVFINKLQI